MALIEMNALSTVLCGSFSAKVFLPEMDKLQLNEKDKRKEYPVLWLYHSDGGNAMDWLNTPAEKCAAEYGIFIIATDVQHALCTNMKYGPSYEIFMAEEFPGICRNNLPISSEPKQNWIGGVGTGAYGAMKAAIKHPNVFSACIAMDGIFDMNEICKKAMVGEATGIHHTEESLKSVFGELSVMQGSEHDLYALAEQCYNGKFYIASAKKSPYSREAVILAEKLGKKAVLTETDGEFVDLTCRNTMEKAVSWLCGR